MVFCACDALATFFKCFYPTQARRLSGKQKILLKKFFSCLYLWCHCSIFCILLDIGRHFSFHGCWRSSDSSFFSFYLFYDSLLLCLYFCSVCLCPFSDSKKETFFFDTHFDFFKHDIFGNSFAKVFSLDLFTVFA